MIDFSHPSSNLKLSKTSQNESLSNFTPNGSFSRSTFRDCEIGNRQRTTAAKTPSKSVLKYKNNSRNSCYY